MAENYGIAYEDEENESEEDFGGDFSDEFFDDDMVSGEDFDDDDAAIGKEDEFAGEPEAETVKRADEIRAILNCTMTVRAVCPFVWREDSYSD